MEDGNFKTLNQLVQDFDIPVNSFLLYHSVINSIPLQWKFILKRVTHEITNCDNENKMWKWAHTRTWDPLLKLKIIFEMCKPRPLPVCPLLDSSCWNFSKSFCWSCSLIPGPVSVTRIFTWPANFWVQKG